MNRDSLRQLEHHDAFLERHIGPNDAEIAHMLRTIGHDSLESLTDAINRGAIYRYFVKPWDDEALRTQIREAFRVAQGLAHA